MLNTSATLIVAGDTSSSSEQDELNTHSTRGPNCKKKKRPQVDPATLSSDGNEQYWRGHVGHDPDNVNSASVKSRNVLDVSKRRYKHPAVREPLAALQKEQQLYELRNKQRGENVDPNIVTDVKTALEKPYRRPYMQAKKEASITEKPESMDGLLSSTIATNTVVKSAADLKAILKNSDGLSLSEILQQKNLSLDDLLKGKQNALLALQTTSVVPTNSTSNYRSANPVRKTTSNSPKNSEERIAIKKTLKFPSQHQRLKIFGSSSRGNSTFDSTDNEQPTTKKRDPVTMTTTTTSTTTAATTRLPAYKRRPHQRPTLKPLSILRYGGTSVKNDATYESSEANTAITTMSSTKVSTSTAIMSIKSQETATNMDTFLAENNNINANESIETYKDSIETQFRNEESMTSNLTQLNTIMTTTTEIITDMPIRESEDSIIDKKPTLVNLTKKTTAKSSNLNRRGFYQGSRTKSRERSKMRNNDSARLRENDKVQRNQSSDEVPDDDDELENFFEEPAQTVAVENMTPLIDHSSHIELTSSEAANYGKEFIPDFDGVDDRTNLLELIEDRRSGNRLFKVLQQRNMTLEELIEHRKRGSSQLHLATIVQQDGDSHFFPGQKVILHDNVDIVTAFENFPHFNLLNLKSVKPDEIKTDSQGSSYFTSIIDIEPTDEIYKDSKTSGNVDPNRVDYQEQQFQRTDKSLNFNPSWKTLALIPLASTSRDNTFYVKQPELLLENSSEDSDDVNNLLSINETSNYSNRQSNIQTEDIEDTVQAIENEMARAHDLLDMELSGHGFKRNPAARISNLQGNETLASFYSNLPAGIRSAIVASAAVLLTSLSTFTIIFMVCRWKQREERKNNYLRTYNAMKSKLPTLTSDASQSNHSSLKNRADENMEIINIMSTNNTSEILDSTTIPTISGKQATGQRHNFRRQTSLPFMHASPNNSIRDTALLKTGRDKKMYTEKGSIGLYDSKSNFCSATESTSSLALSLQSAHNISSTKLNTMDPNSPVVQEYLFDTIRKSFVN